MRFMSIDIETYSSVDLAAAGVYKYAESPDFEVLIIGFQFSDEDRVRQIDLLSPTRKTSYEEQAELMEFRKALYDSEVLKTAFNANFERSCLAKWSGREMPPEQWSDTMILAAEMGLPRSLAEVGLALGLPEDKLKDPQGKALIQYFSKPCKATKANGGRTRNLPAHDPAKWSLYLSYNRQDVVTERAIRAELLPLAGSEQRLWCLDQRINDTGVRLDVPMIKKIVSHDQEHREDLQREARELTGLQNPNSLAQLKPWLNDHGLPMESVTKETIAAALTLKYIPDDIRRVLEIRTALGKTSVAKYSAMLEAVCDDDRLRGLFQFYGARSGRWTGKIVQPQNLARNSLPDLDLARELAASGDFETMETLYGETSFILSELIRTAFIPSEGCRFVVSDFSAIEARVISWLAGEEWRLNVFRNNGDIYCESASQMYHVPVVKHGINGELRQKGKIAELALGYQGGVGAMKQMDRGGSIPEEEMQGIVDHWRDANPKIVKLWKSVENRAKNVINGSKSARFENLSFSYRNNNLFILLPSGRQLCYWDADLTENQFGNTSICYKGVNQTTKKWESVETYGGKLVENIVQAIARDCLAEAMKRVTAAGYKIVMHVHDEMIIDAPKEDTGATDIINGIMAQSIDWAEGLPLKGETYETDFYKKD